MVVHSVRPDGADDAVPALHPLARSSYVSRFTAFGSPHTRNAIDVAVYPCEQRSGRAILEPQTVRADAVSKRAVDFHGWSTHFRFLCPSNLCAFLLPPALAKSLSAPLVRSSEDRPSQAQAASTTDVPRGKKLVLKDGTFQVVREYQRNGDRVRYFSLERGDSEELPSSLVDWDATAKDEVISNKTSNDLTAKVHAQEEAKRLDNVADIDASLQVGAGAFLRRQTVCLWWRESQCASCSKPWREPRPTN